MAAHRLPFLAACVLFAPLGVAGAQDPPAGYYDTVDPTDANTLRQTLHAVIDDHQRFPYTSGATDTWDILELADENPSNPAHILDVYRNASYAKEGGGNPNYQREHTWPNSYGFPNDNSSNYPYTDCHQLFLCDGGYNAARSNKPYRNCDSACNELPTQVNEGAGGGSGTYPGNSNWESGFLTDGTFEAWVGRRGDVARGLLYLDVRYEGGQHSFTGHNEPDLILTDTESLIAASSTGQNESVAYMGMLTVLLQWHLDDPVDQKERDRNDAIFLFQGNRNPFIDHPEWVDILWGDGGGSGSPLKPWINEFHYDNSGTDAGEFIEIAGPAGLNVSGYRLVGYNGSGGGEYDAESLSGVIPDQGECIGTLSFPFTGLQNGAPDGIALVDSLNEVIEFLSYEGVIVATDGPADGMTSVDVGFTEGSGTPVGHSIQRVGTGSVASDFVWAAPSADSPGAANAGQTFSEGCGGTTTIYGCGVNPAGSLVVVSGTPTVDTTLTLGVDNPLGTQAPGSLTFIALSFAPDALFPCGIPVPGLGMAGGGAPGELLISFVPPSPFLSVTGVPWFSAGNPSAVPLPFPDNPNLVGFTVYAQGLIWDISPGATAPFGLTDGAALLIGG
ncbi:MAG: endonuclease [Planctomycetota bacterium]